MKERNSSLVRKIVITGGPCAGKTTGMSWIQNTFEKMGYTLLFLQEPATELMSAGITPARCSSSLAYQEFQMKVQLEKDRVFTQAAVDIAEKGTQGYAFRELWDWSGPAPDTGAEGAAVPPAERIASDVAVPAASCAAGSAMPSAERVSPDAAVPSAACAEEPSAAVPSVSRTDGQPALPRKTLIVCDRGFLDNKAYMTEEEFAEACRVLGVTEEEMLLNYDAVFHLETAAKNAVIFYGSATNAVRSESPAEAAALDDRVIAAWAKHPHFRIIENLNGFEDKMNHLVAEIAAFLGEPVPHEISRRLLIDWPDISVLEALPDCHLVRIEQVYLHSAQDEEIRIRRRESGADVTYYLTRKKLEGGKKRLEAEGRLTEREYQQFLANADPGKRPIRKTRYCLQWEGQYFEVDLYPFWQDRAILEVSLHNEEDEIRIPPFLQVIRDVTSEENYQISVMASVQAGNV